MSCAAVVLAAGLGTRFGGGKLLAPLDGRPVLQHVLDTAAEAGLEPVMVVLGRDAESIEAAIAWRAERRVRNPWPERGLAGSVVLGLAEAVRDPAADRAVVLLGDQPRVQRAQIAALVAQPRDDDRPFVVPRYADGQSGNPVLVERSAWPLAEGLTGDRGLSALFAARPELVRHVDLGGTNPDVDTPADLAALSRAEAPGRSGRTAGGGRSRP